METLVFAAVSEFAAPASFLVLEDEFRSIDVQAYWRWRTDVSYRHDSAAASAAFKEKSIVDSEDEFVLPGLDDDGDESGENESVGAWDAILHPLDARDDRELDFELITAAIQEWNLDKRANFWSKKVSNPGASSDRVDEFKQKVQQRYDSFMKSLMKYLNKFWVFIKEQTAVIQRVRRDVTEHQNPGRTVEDFFKQTEPAFKIAMQNRSAWVKFPDHKTGALRLGKTIQKLAVLWLESPYRNEKQRVAFIPKESNPDSRDFNLWCGFAWTAAMAAQYASENEEKYNEDKQVIINHLHDIWCNGDVQLSEYVLNWFAHVLQRPETKLGTALLVRGDHGNSTVTWTPQCGMSFGCKLSLTSNFFVSFSGCGKSVILTMMRDIIGRAHFTNFVNLSDVTAAYNADSLERCILGAVDEVQANDKTDMSRIKALITEDRVRLEQKYIAKFEVASYTNFVLTSNSHHMMKIETSERRFLALEANGKYSGSQSPESKAYHERLRAVAPAALAHFLYTRDLKGFSSYTLPITRETVKQKLLSLNGVQRWWIMCLREEAIPCEQSFPLVAGISKTWSYWRNKSKLFEEYKKWSIAEESTPLEENMFWNALGKCAVFKTDRKTDSNLKKRVHVVQFQTIAVCTHFFASDVLRLHGGNVDMFREWLSDSAVSDSVESGDVDAHANKSADAHKHDVPDVPRPMDED